jgi:hypothetical protein
LDFWFENKPSGNPAVDSFRLIEFLAALQRSVNKKTTASGEYLRVCKKAVAAVRHKS